MIHISMLNMLVFFAKFFYFHHFGQEESFASANSGLRALVI